MASETLRIQLRDGESAQLPFTILRLTAADQVTVEQSWRHSEADQPDKVAVVLRIDREGVSV